MASRLQDLRMAAGLSQQKLATVCGLSIAAIQKYEQHVNSISSAKYTTLLKISEALGVAFWELFDDPETREAALRNACRR